MKNSIIKNITIHNIYESQKIAQIYNGSIKLDLITCTFSSSLKLYKLTNPNQDQIKVEIKKYVTPLINILTLLSNNLERVEFALDTVAHLNFLNHLSIYPIFTSPRAINGFIKFCKNISIDKTFEEMCHIIMNDDPFFKRLLKFKIEPGHIQNGGRNVIYSNNGIKITPSNYSTELRIFTQKLPSNINSLRGLTILIAMFGDYDKFKIDTERLILKNL